MKLARLDRGNITLALVAALIVLERIAAQLFGTGESVLAPGESVRLGTEVSLLVVWGVGHCDTLDGPVVTLARKALDTDNVNFVLPWVGPGDEPEIRKAFDHAIAVRRQGGPARELADRYFFETLVRVHRAGEGAPFTGLKPAGLDLGPAVPAADRALEDGSVDAVVKLLTDAVREGVRHRFHTAMSRKVFDVNDVRAGRSYVEAYVPYVHYVERLWQAATMEAHGHHPEPVVHEHAERERAVHAH